MSDSAAPDLRIMEIPPNGLLRSGTWLRLDELRVWLVANGASEIAAAIDFQVTHGDDVARRSVTVRR